MRNEISNILDKVILGEMTHAEAEKSIDIIISFLISDARRDMVHLKRTGRR